MTWISRSCFVLLVAFAAASGGARARGASAEERFAEAQALFEAAQKRLAEEKSDPVEARRMFHEAAGRFAGIAAEGVASVNLCVNTGNAYHFAGDNARALLWYLRAEKLANTPEVRSGLATLRRIINAEPRPPERTSIGRVLMFWHYDLSRRTKQVLMLATYPIGCGLLLAGLMSRRRVLLRLAVTFMLMGGVVGVSDLMTAMIPPAPWAVVVEPGEGRSGNGSAYSVIVPSVRMGQEVRIIERRPDWVRVEMPSGVRCWLPAETCEAV
ncbi:MAG TPA: hypothetical protein PLL20_00100 [Phycisphaerae bacterium]|nr:hypothetical protein [Phycisphaerae bacterium]HRR84162.1 hypothetical protein [Phycisphaerae bacterium]